MSLLFGGQARAEYKKERQRAFQTAKVESIRRTLPP